MKQDEEVIVNYVFNRELNCSVQAWCVKIS